ncbi:unnamed protein product [Rotaria sp. Silwood2]|nr:unnamed protein product [Rotaria sp. Silwood2]CAF4501011.1 unnamed protein product [Rotaria sp. Silwood2]
MIGVRPFTAGHERPGVGYIDNDTQLKDYLNEVVEKQLLNLKRFSLALKCIFSKYNEFLIPFLHKMLNVKELNNSFYCHIYSYPYIWSYYNNISNNFRGGLFKYVRKISLRDERSFEHEFFLQISHSFPFIEELSLRNYQQQKNNNQQWSIIQYSRLNKLDLVYIHEDYVEQFLIDTKTCLLNNVFLCVSYDYLQKVTENFTRDAMRVNCAKINRLFLHRMPLILAVDFKDFFPYAIIE